MEEMTYSESAHGVMISFDRVLQEFRSHSVAGPDIPDMMAELCEELGVDVPADRRADWVDAGDVLAFLGY